MLHEKLTEMLDRAATDNATKLHQFIVGPAGSGRTTQAAAYAAELIARGFANQTRSRKDFATVSFDNPGDVSAVTKLMGEAAGGVLIVDHFKPRHDIEDGQKLLHNRLVRAIDQQTTTVVFISTPADLAEALRNMPEISQRLRTTINMPKTFSPDEIAAYHHDLKEGDRIRQRIAEWKAARDEDLRPKERHAAPQTARFVKPAGGA
ncbi:MAG: hypothetical protein K0R10_1035 [Alphaproteobacteria bacterium]|nr:hypothetical protein [Alphaproteobacteria bacterium]